MSRTYRRKQGLKEDKWWVLREYNCYWDRRYNRISEHSKEGKKAIAKYHSDAEVTMQQVPKWYKVLFLRRPFRAKEKQVIRKIMKYREEEVFPLSKNAANYYW